MEGAGRRQNPDHCHRSLQLYACAEGSGGGRFCADADLVIWDPDAAYVITKDMQQSAADYCPFEGTRIQGRASQVYVRGRLVAKDGAIVAEHAGAYVAASNGRRLPEWSETYVIQERKG